MYLCKNFTTIYDTVIQRMVLSISRKNLVYSHVIRRCPTFGTNRSTGERERERINPVIHARRLSQLSKKFLHTDLFFPSSLIIPRPS